MVRKKYNPAPATAKKIPKILAEFSPKFTIDLIALHSCFYGSEFLPTCLIQ
jgi:hypothetical protein